MGVLGGGDAVRNVPDQLDEKLAESVPEAKETIDELGEKAANAASAAKEATQEAMEEASEDKPGVLGRAAEAVKHRVGL